MKHDKNTQVCNCSTAYQSVKARGLIKALLMKGQGIEIELVREGWAFLDEDSEMDMTNQVRFKEES